MGVCGRENLRRGRSSVVIDQECKWPFTCVVLFSF
jgi:hypothetical protein